MASRYIIKSTLLFLAVTVFAVSLALAIFCPECGQSCPDGFKFCPRCGAGLGQAYSVINDAKGTTSVSRAYSPPLTSAVGTGARWSRYGKPAQKEIDDFLLGKNSLLVDMEDMELVNGQSSYYIFQLDLIDEMYERHVDGKVDHKNSHGKKYWIYKVGNVTIERYQHMQQGKWMIETPSEDGDFEMITSEGIKLGMGIGEVRDRLRNSTYKFSRESSRKKTRILKYQLKRKWKVDFYAEFYFSPGDNRLQKMRFGLLSIN